MATKHISFSMHDAINGQPCIYKGPNNSPSALALSAFKRGYPFKAGNWLVEHLYHDCHQLRYKGAVIGISHGGRIHRVPPYIRMPRLSVPAQNVIYIAQRAIMRL